MPTLIDSTMFSLNSFSRSNSIIFSSRLAYSRAFCSAIPMYPASDSSSSMSSLDRKSPPARRPRPITAIVRSCTCHSRVPGLPPGTAGNNSCPAARVVRCSARRRCSASCGFSRNRCVARVRHRRSSESPDRGTAAAHALRQAHAAPPGDTRPGASVPEKPPPDPPAASAAADPQSSAAAPRRSVNELSPRPKLISV